MEIFLISLVVAFIAIAFYYNRSSKSLDINKDGKVDTADVKAAVQNVVCGVQETADVNKDGKVDSADAKVVVENVKTTAKKASSKTKAAVIKAKTATTRGRKPKAK